jgi:hypothetical protein
MRTITMNAPAPRHDLYTFIHKALRAYMTHTLLRVGRVDAADEQEVAEVAEEVRTLLDFCASHVHHENEIVHAAMEARRPGSATAIEVEHVHHEATIEGLRMLVGAMATGPAGVQALYRALAAFVAENLVHMEQEETAHNAVLWAAYSDEELRAIEQRIHQRVAPQQMQIAMRWMLPHLTPAERAMVLGGVRAHAPADAFNGLINMVRPLLGQRDWRKLSLALGV